MIGQFHPGHSLSPGQLPHGQLPPCLGCNCPGGIVLFPRTPKESCLLVRVMAWFMFRVKNGVEGGNFPVTGTIDLEPYSEPCQMPKMEFFTKIVSDSKPLTIFAKNSTLDVSQGSEYVSDINITM